MISAATPLRKIVRVVEHIDDLEGYNILNVLQNHNLVNPTTGFFDSSLVTEAHIPILLDIINKFASEADSEMWFQYINSDRPRLGKLEDIWEDIKLRRKEAKKKPLLDYVPSPGSKSKVLKFTSPTAPLTSTVKKYAKEYEDVLFTSTAKKEAVERLLLGVF